jgi:hypothetical protein
VLILVGHTVVVGLPTFPSHDHSCSVDVVIDHG